jgi:hypothetical protein
MIMSQSRLLLALSAAGLLFAACGGSNEARLLGIPPTPDPDPAPMATDFRQFVLNEIAMNTNATALPVDINQLMFEIDNDDETQFAPLFD